MFRAVFFSASVRACARSEQRDVVCSRRTLASAYQDQTHASLKDKIMSNPIPEPISSFVAATLNQHTPERRRSLASKLFNLIPTLLTFGLLAVVAFFGHHFGWKMPKASELQGAPVTAKKANWCSEHNVPEDECVECNPKLMPKPEKPRWCKEHGVFECPTHHPKLAQVVGEPKLPQYDTVEAINLFDRSENNSRCKKFLNRIQYESVEAFAKQNIDVDVATER
ncbi:MAG: hypothetical protein FD138_3806, partial [Planctomycetota bacterium]